MKCPGLIHEGKKKKNTVTLRPEQISRQIEIVGY